VAVDDHGVLATQVGLEQDMAFGQTSGPPAGVRQIEQLSELLERAGFSSFREARHRFGLNQRQAAGKFTVTEASELIERLEAAEIVSRAEPGQPANDPAADPVANGGGGDTASTTTGGAAAGRARRRAELLGGLEDSVIAAELERRGWCCIAPIVDEPH